MTGPLELELPLLAADTPQSRAIRTMVEVGHGFCAVEAGDGIALVRSPDLLRAETSRMTLGQIAHDYGLTSQDGFRLITIDVASVKIAGEPDLFRMDVPAAYKQCTIDPEHLYDLDYDAPRCEIDDGKLRIVYL